MLIVVYTENCTIMSDQMWTSEWKAIIYRSVLNSQAFETREEMMRLSPLFSFGSRNTRPTSASHFRFSGACLGATDTSILLEEPLIETLSFHHEAIRHDARSLTAYAPCSRRPIQCRLSQNQASLPMPISFLLRGNKTRPTHSLSRKYTQVLCGVTLALSF